MVPTKREFPLDDRDRQFGTVPKAPRLENSFSVTQPHREQAKSVSPSLSKVSTETAKPRERAVSAERSTATSPKPTAIETRRYSDVIMAEASPRISKPPMSATSSAPEVLQDSDDDVDLDEDDFAESEAKYNREVARLEAKRIDLSASHLRATTPLQEIVLLSSLTVDHLPQKEMESKQGTEDETVPMHQDDDNSALDQQRPESVVAELPTPKYDRSDDVEMGEVEDRDDKLDRSTAPATMALRLRREGSANEETLPDMSSLPYLGSGPPTPLSDIGQDRPSLSESIRLAMREKLRKSIEPELTQNETLRQYAAVYKQWRTTIRPWDEERDQDDQERQPSVEPTLKALTPDVQSAAMTGILDGSLASTGRRGHASRWATELDLEAAIAESLKTAEEEKLGKKDKEPRKSMADPEKEADLPTELTESEAQRRRYIDTNFQREPGQGIFAFHYEPPEDDFTEEEHRVMVHNYKDQFAKKWGKLAEVLYKEVGTERTYKDCINHYYATKWGREYKGKLRGKRGGPKKRGGAVARGRAAIANMERPEQSGEDGLPLPVTETGRPRRSAAPTFGGTEQEVDPNAVALTSGRARRQTDADGTQEKGGRRGKGKDKIGRKAKNMPLAAAPVGSPVKIDRKDKGQSMGVKLEDEVSKRPLGEMPLPIHAGLMEEQMLMASNQHLLADLPPGILERSKLAMPPARPGPSSYWSVSELQDFDKNVAHFGTDWLAIANHMGTKTHTMIKNQYLRLVESGRLDLEQMAKEADVRRERGDELGPPPTPTPAPKRRYESTQATPIRQIAPTPEHKSPLMNPHALPKAPSPHSASSSRFSTIAQAPVQGKPSLPASGFPSLPEPSLVSVPSMPPQQSPPAPPQRTQPQHHHQHSMSQHKQPQHGPRAGYFSDDMPPRHENRPPPQSPANQQPPRHLQQHGQPQGRSQEQHQSPLYRSLQFSERENVARNSVQQEQEAQHRFQHQRRISHELQNHRPFGPGQPLPLMPTVRSNSDLRSPEQRPLPYSHSRHVSQAHSIGHSPSDNYGQGLPSIPSAQQLPPRSSILTPPVKEEPRNPPPLMPQPQPQPQPMSHSQHQHQQLNQPSMQKAPPPSLPKPVAEPRKSNLMSLLNDTPPEEPRRKKPSDQGPPSHTTTPQQSTPIAPPPPTSQPYSSSTRRTMYDDQGAAQSSYNRPSYAQQSALPPTTANRSIDMTNEQSAGGRTREGWPQRPQYLHSQSHGPQSVSLPSSQPGPPQPGFNDNRMFPSHRSVFAQHNGTRHNPSPPPHGYNNSPHMHSRTPSISGAPSQVNRHATPSTAAGQQSQAASASAQILQPNPYAQVDPPGPIGMRPSPHLHTSHVAHQRDAPGRNEHSQTQNANLSYSNPQTPNEHPGHPQLGGPRGLNEPYRPRDPREPHRELDSRNSDRDTGRELAQRTEYLREQLSNPALRSNGPPMHDDVRFQPQERQYLPQRSQTPLSRPEHSQTPQLQHPPHSSLGVANHPIYNQRSHEEPAHRFSQPTFPRDRSIADRIRDEQAQQAQQQAAMNREEQMRRDRERDMHERELRDREIQDVRYRENLMRSRDMRGPPPPGSAPEQRPDQRAPTGPGPMDWNRHPQDRGGWSR
ncbi:hypothetical protein T440DRAFT_388523 [Plenodomus tracheiphilus IPT5]|uniref:Myb-like domain-containing protein n=1 Tax=Plenodomus tracheiphilus IPT5 TaxID=1408161 RepID=A0A6A7BI89_9PLEO|nr:hypothetical protein T440DRAFT_388523 [Plenodomus tracheiphilus IPT5]